ncbi:acyltransferase family protein [Pseudonocardia benzenivorans]
MTEVDPAGATAGRGTGGTAAAGDAEGLVARDRYVDLLRAFSILVVVLWHWAFTILVWGPSGPSATSPLGFTSGLWVLTWLFQVLPLFFYVGGYVHLRAWQRACARGEHLGHFVWRNIRRLSRRRCCSRSSGSGWARVWGRSSTSRGSGARCCSSSARCGSSPCTSA